MNDVNQDAPLSNSKMAFLKIWGPLIVAALALAQPWGLDLWRAAFERRVLLMNRNRMVQLELTNAGASVTIDGTLEATKKPRFVRTAELAILLPFSDTAERIEVILKWRNFRSTSSSMNTGATSGLSYKLPAGFWVHSNQPARFGIEFFDYDTWLTVRDTQAEFETAWFSKRKDLFGFLSPPQMWIQPHDVTRIENAFIELKDSPLGKQFSSVVQKANFWIPGKYDATLRMYIAGSSEPVEDRFSFELTDSEVNRLGAYDEVLRSVAGHWPNTPPPMIFVRSR